MMKIRNFTARLVALAMVAAMAVGMMTACGKGTGDVENTTAMGADETETVSTAPAAEPGTPEVQGDPIALTSDFVLVCGDTQNDNILKLVNTLKTKIKAKTGLTLSLGHVGSPKENEIVIGYTDSREACDEAYGQLARDDYNVYASAGTVVLGAWTNDNLNAAADLLVEKALVKEGEQWMIYPYLVSFGGESAGVDLTQYRIVYAEGAGSVIQNIVTQLKTALQNTFGVTVEAVTDAETPSACEIVVGQTNRESAAVSKYLSGGEAELQYYGHAIVTDGTRIYLVARADLALYRAVTKLCELTVPEVGPSTFCLTSEPWVSAGADTTDRAELAEGADIRVMSYNILHPSWSNVVSNVPVEGRDTNVANILLYYMPDVVGLQEVNSSWHNALKTLLVDTGIYAKACEKSNAGAYNMTTFLYNTQTVKLIDSYVLDLDRYSEIRVLSVAVFEKLSDGTRFVVTNNHPAPTGQAENYARNFADLMTLAQSELEKYKDLPVIMTGDFNTKEQAAMYTTFMETAGVKDAKYEADVLVRDYCTFSGWPNVAPKSGNASCIDHIFVNDKTDVKLFNVVIDHDVESTSDHIPIYADIDLK